jgi:peroxiredoxin
MLSLCLALVAGFSAFPLRTVELQDGPKSPAAGLRLTYSGKLQPTNPTGDDPPARSFRLSFLVTEVTATGGCRVAWLLEEGAGTPRWSWAQRFGTMPLNRSLATTSDRELPAIQAERDGAVRAIGLRPPFFAAPEPLKAGAQWGENELQFEVIGREEVTGRRSWKVSVSGKTGPREIVWVDEQDSVMTRHRELVFLGQGVPHELSLDLDKAETLSAEDLPRHSKAHTSLVGLRGPVKDKLSELQESAIPASPELLARARTASTEIQGDLKAGSYVDLAKEIVRDTQSAINRQGDLDKIRDQLVGKPAKGFSLKTTRGDTISLADLKGKPFVLHFWDYRSEPKIAPYGETGFLDFLFRQREKQGIRVVGVAVDNRLRDDATRAAARKDIRSFCDFMNLSYPVAFDDGDEKIIDQFGDPRSVGAKLPLYVVVAPDGTVAEYHPGLWSATADEGLKELDQRLQKFAR